MDNELYDAILNAGGNHKDVLKDIIENMFDIDTVLEAVAEKIETGEQLHKLICNTLNKTYFDKNTPNELKRFVNGNLYQVEY